MAVLHSIVKRRNLHARRKRKLRSEASEKEPQGHTAPCVQPHRSYNAAVADNGKVLYFRNSGINFNLSIKYNF